MSNKIKILNLFKKGKKYQIQTNEDEYLFTEDTVLKFLVFKDKEFFKEEFEEVLKYEEQTVLFNKTLNYLSYRPRSVQEVRDYLLKRTDESHLDQIILRLTSLGYLDDALYSKNYFDYTLRSLKGPRYLLDNLRKKGISQDLIKDALTSYSEALEEEIVFKIIEKHKDRLKTKPIKKQRLYLLQKLQRDGFRNDSINNCLRQTEFIDESKDQLVKEIMRLQNKYSALNSKEQKARIISRLMNSGYNYSDILLYLKAEE